MYNCITTEKEISITGKETQFCEKKFDDVFNQPHFKRADDN